MRLPYPPIREIQSKNYLNINTWDLKKFLAASIENRKKLEKNFKVARKVQKKIEKDKA